jgi:predicted dinucleotide-binding enzyme
MTIGIIGSGNVGKIIARKAIEAGNTVVISNSRGPESLKELTNEMAKGITAGTVAEASEQDIVFLAVPWTKAHEAIGSLPDWGGRILVDVTNQFISAYPEMEVDNTEPLTGSEVIASYAPGARVIKAFNALYGQYMDGETPNGRRVLFFAGDDAEAKSAVAKLFADMKFHPVDVGSLRDGGRLMQVGGGFLSGTHFVQPEE